MFLKLRLHATDHGVLHFTWVAVGLPFIVVVGAAYLPFLLSLPRRFRQAMFLAGFVYISGVLGMEMLDGWYADHYGENTVYMLMTMVEELLEMGGAILFIRCLLQYLREHAGAVRLVAAEGRAIAAAIAIRVPALDLGFSASGGGAAEPGAAGRTLSKVAPVVP